MHNILSGFFFTQIFTNILKSKKKMNQKDSKIIFFSVFNLKNNICKDMRYTKYLI